MKNHALLAAACNCTPCTQPMEFFNRPSSIISDGSDWRCTNQSCAKRHTYTIYTDPFFKKSRVTLDKRLYIIYLWSQQNSYSSSDFSTTKLVNTPIDLGGTCTVAEIEESLFNLKSKYNRSRRPQKEQKVFGLANTSHKPSITSLELMDKRDAATLLTLIRKAVKPGTIIHSDQWKA